MPLPDDACTTGLMINSHPHTWQDTSTPAARDAYADWRLEPRNHRLVDHSVARLVLLTLVGPRMATGSRCVPILYRLEARGFEFRACRDTLRPLVDLADLDPDEAETDAALGGEMPPHPVHMHVYNCTCTLHPVDMHGYARGWPLLWFCLLLAT